jgi:hypothetical protein
MNRDDVNQLATQLAAEAAAPLIHEAAARLELTLDADDNLGLRVLSDLAMRVFAAGFRFGVTETTARFLEQLPPNVSVAFRPAPPDAADTGPLGEHPDFAGL